MTEHKPAGWQEAVPEISVIVPVYNVGEYLDICMESIVNQTYPDLEILLIDDGSTDDSPERCMRWAEQDARVRVIRKENEGVAPTRNLGVRESRGRYLAFVDPDDWLDLTYMEKLHDRLEETGSDFAECDIWRYDNRTGKKIYRSCSGRTGKPYTLREHMKYGPTATYKSLFRRTLWEKYGIRIPDCAFESPAIYALLVALSGRVESIPEALYYYRRFRENSLIENGYAKKDGTPNNTLGIEAMEHLLQEFRRCGIYEEYADTLEGVVKYRLNDILAMQFHRKRPEDFRQVVQNYRAFLETVFPQGCNETYITWGGYNLNRILAHMDCLHDPYARFNFSSIISLVSPEVPEYSVSHRNRYRDIMLERERTRAYWEILAELQPGWLVLDLIEERFDLLQLGDGLVTKSDAFDGASFRWKDGESAGPDELLRRGRVIPRSGERCAELWKNAVRDFADRTRKTCPGIRFLVVENYLSTAVGDLETRRPFEDAEEIRQMNRVLEGMYAELRTVLPDAEWISPAGDDLYFTDWKYEYGAVPSHLNEIENARIARSIERSLGTGR